MPTRTPTPTYADAIALLKADHRKVEDLFDKFEAASDAKKPAIARQICDELKIHTVIEEEIFYPALEGRIEAGTWTEAFVEHDGAKVLINDILATAPDDQFYAAKVKVLSEEIRRHVHEEEARAEGMFAQARAAGVDLVALRDAMLARKEDLMAQAKAGELPPAQTRVVKAAA